MDERVLENGFREGLRGGSATVETETQFRGLLEKLPAGAYTCDPDGLITYFNQSAVRLWGRAPGLNDPSDRFCGSFRLFGTDGKPIAHDRCWMAMALKTGSEYNRREIVIERPDGRRLTALAHANPIHDESGELLGAVNVLVDITERKRTEEERDRIFDLSLDLLCVAGLDGYFKRVNPAFEETLGYTREELLARPFVEFVHPDDRAATRGELERLATGVPTLRFENRYLRKDGSHAWLAWKAVPVTQDGLIYAAARDVTEQKRSEEELRSAELFARSTLNSLSANIAILDETGVIVATNRAWREFGASNEAPVTARVGEGANYLRVCDEASGEGSEEASAFAAGIRDVISGRRETFELEYPCHSPAEERWFVGRVMRFPDTRPPKIVVAHENITGRKRSEEEIRARARQQAALAKLGQRALAQSNLTITLHEATAMFADTLSVDHCEVLELLPDGQAWLLRAGVGWGEEAETVLDPQARYALRSGEPVIVEDLREDGRFGGPPPGDLGALSGISVVIPGRDGPFGVLGAHTRDRRVFTADDANLLRAAANVLAAAVERRRTEEEMREVREAERRRIARDMHDDALQDLTYVLAETQLIRDMSEDPRLDARLRRAVEALKRTGQGLRAAIFDLRLGEDPDFVAQLEALVDLNRQYSPDLAIEFVVEGDVRPPLDDPRQTELLRIVQEALANSRRHSEAGRVRVVVGVTGDGALRTEVSDDGKGFAAGTPVGLGTRGMRERARALGGDLRITSKPGEGTTVRFEMDFGEVAGGSGQRTRVLLVEDHASLRQAVAALLDREPDLTVVGQAGTLAQARGMLEGVDVAVIDLALPDGRGTELIREMREVDPRAQAIVLSAYSDRAEVALAVESGAAGVLHKSAGVGEVADAVRRLRAGESLLALEEVVDLLRFAGSHRDQEHEAQQTIARLTAREKEVLAAVAEGLDGKEISERLNISLRTERNHMASILSKLGVNSRLQALVFALRHGLVEVT